MNLNLTPNLEPNVEMVEDYAPMKMRIASITPETSDIKIFRLNFCGQPVAEEFSFLSPAALPAQTTARWSICCPTKWRPIRSRPRPD